MSRNILIEISVLNPASQLITTLHMAASNSTAEGVYLDGKTWIPAIINDPEQSFGYWGDGRAQSLSVSYGQINFIVSKQLGNKAWTKLDFDGGDATVWDGEMGAAFSDYKQIYTGKIGPLVSDSSREAHFSLLGMEAQLDRDLLDRTFAGTGGNEGPSSMLGILKPISFGDCQNVPPVKLDPIRFIYCVDGYKAVTVNTIYSSALTLGAPVTTVASYAALAALTLKPGEWARCPSYFRLGGDPGSAKITADIGTPATTSDVARALVVKAGILPARIGASFTTGTRGYSLYLTDQANIGDAVRDAAFAESRLLLTDSRGVLHLAPMASAKAAVTLADDGSSRPFVRSDTIIGEAPASPSWKVRIGHTPVWTVNAGAGEISEAVATQGADLTASRKAADDARAEADKANAAINIIEKRLDATVADGILDRAEKRQWIASYEAATAERDALVGEGTDQGAAAQVAAYNAAYDALKAYLDGLVPAFADTTKDTSIDGATFKARFVGYAVAKQALLNAIADKASKTSTWDGVTGPAKPTDYADVTGNNTSKDTSAVGGVPSGTVISNIGKNAADISKAISDAIAEQERVIAAAKVEQDRVNALVEAKRIELVGKIDTDVGAAKTEAANALASGIGDVKQTITELQTGGSYDETARAGVRDVITAYKADDKVLADRQVELNTAIGNANSDIRSVSTALTTKEAAITKRIDDSQTEYRGFNSTTNTRITNEVSTISTTTGGLAKRADALEATINTPGSGLNAKVGSHENVIVNLPNNYTSAGRGNTLEAQMRRETPSALNNAINDVNGRIDTVNGATITNLNARIEERAQAWASQEAGAVASRANTLEAQLRRETPSALNNAINDVNGRIDTVNGTTITNLNARIEERAQAWASQEAGAVASRANTLEAQLRREAPSALNNAINDVNGRIDTVNGTTITNLNARIEERATAIADAKAGAVASTVSTLRTEYNKTVGDLTTVSSVASDAYGRSRAYIQQTAIANGNRAQLTLYADSNSGGGVDLIGDLSISGNLLVGGTVTAGKMAPSSVQQVAYMMTGYDIYIPRGGSYPGNPGPTDPGPTDPDNPLP